ncbi:hypothetical protein [Micromonospora sp. NPDC005324]|uniref:hypothetical protein n=1 Tax=Micromonospora sp. NPDC005324 TaxID=3157033 RepID=UPI0033B87846
MSFPDDPLNVQVRIAPGANPAADPLTYQWVDITDRLQRAEPITISRGRSTPLADTVPSSCSLRLNNADGRFTPRNPVGPYYGQLQRNTPLQVRLLHVVDVFDRTVSNGWGSPAIGSAWTTSGGSASDYFTDGSVAKQSLGTVNVLRQAFADTGVTSGEMTVDVTNPLGTPNGAAVTHWVVGRAEDPSNFYAARLDIKPGGGVDLQIVKRVGGVLTGLAAVTNIGTHASSTWRVVFSWMGSELRAKAWKPASDSPPGWQVGAVDTSLSSGTQCGLLTRLEGGNTNTLPVVVSYDNVEVTSPRFTGYVDRWPPRWDPSGNLRWVPIQAFGTLKRISSAGEATRSPLYRYYTEQQTFNKSGYWPLEDGSLATEGASAMRTVDSLVPSAPVRFGQSSPLGGVGTMVDTSGAYLQARIPPEYATDWRMECVVAHDEVPTTSTRVVAWLTPGTIQAWNLFTTATGFSVNGYSAMSGGTFLIGVNTGILAQPGRLHHIRIDVTLSGGSNSLQVWVDGVSGGSATLGSSLTLQPTLLRVNPDAAQVIPAVGHIGVWSASPLPATTSAAVALGSPGELAHARVAAVCAERQVPYAPYPVAGITSEAMGPRLSGSLMAQLRDAEATDGGILYELTCGRLTYRPRSTLYNQPVTLALDYAARHIAPPMEPSDDDATLRNDVTARRPSGSDARYVDEAHIAAVGRWEQPLSANPSTDAQLEQLAAWAVHRGTVAEQRFDTITLRMTAGDAVTTAWLGCDIGSRLTVANVPASVTPDPVDQILVGYVETFGEHPVWTVQALCEPASSWTIGRLNDPVLGRLDTAGSQLSAGDASAQIRGDAPNRAVVAAGLDVALFAPGARVALYDSAGRRKEPTVFTITSIAGPAFGVYDMFLDPLPAETVRGNFTGDYDSVRRVDGTSLSVATAAGPVWTTNVAHVPFDVNVAGERVTVTAISGASSPQTFTVTRAVNGVEKGHAAGTDVRLWQPLILGL